MMNKKNLHIPELVELFSNWNSFRTSDLRDFYKSRSDQLTENNFRRILYSLEKQNIIRKIDFGLYIFENHQAQIPKIPKFLPVFSNEVISLNEQLIHAFPYMEYIIWETRLLHEFMIHQPSQNQIILEIEQGVEESVFNFINQKYEGKAFLFPNREIIERYALGNKNDIFISTLLIQAPIQRVDTIPCPKIEKILVDIFADDDKFYLFQGGELVNIFESIFSSYHVGQKALFRYAQRRKVDDEIREFITQKTKIQLN